MQLVLLFLIYGPLFAGLVDESLSTYPSSICAVQNKSLLAAH